MIVRVEVIYIIKALSVVIWTILRIFQNAVSASRKTGLKFLFLVYFERVKQASRLIIENYALKI